MRPLRITLHHSATLDGLTFTWNEMQKYDISYAYEGEIITREKAMELVGQGKRIKRPLRDIGYHFGIGKFSNLQYSNIIMGRFPYEKGSHSGQSNFGSLQIVFIGNFDNIEVPIVEWELGIKLVRYLQKRYTIKASDVKGHRELEYLEEERTCPGKLFDLDKFRKALLLI